MEHKTISLPYILSTLTMEEICDLGRLHIKDLDSTNIGKLLYVEGGIWLLFFSLKEICSQLIAQDLSSNNNVDFFVLAELLIDGEINSEVQTRIAELSKKFLN